MKNIFFLLLLAATTPAAALELSLEENRGESGTVGYVDIDRVFKEYSGTLNAREEFLGEIRKKESSVNQRRHEIYVLKADIAKLRQEREFALTLPSIFATQEQLNSAKSPAVPAQTVESTPSSTQTAASASVAAETITSAPSDKSFAGQRPFEAPGVSTGAKENFSVPVSSTGTAASAGAAVNASSAAVMAVSTAPASAPLPRLEIDMPGVSRVPVNYFKFSVSTSVPEIDAVLSAKEADLKQKEEALKLYQRQVEKELLEYESHKSEILLGRIYITLKELAVREEVSVIIDKRNILFGHSAVDLTDNLLRKLEEPQ
jgi:Skp family chaperone for outer membrane proteins